ncbi:hypothetical protein QWJ34_16780 [Saccharibacillus sp. CPCC 101409]|uniref:hypothetical protein n=1 Tax=Saccharibacillus sp. CPCC 101409 TaxID=3058041 RepID=UPI0026717CEA|nr:hypothetical protein [Saccharibacillus sp. CPCC 101409]MDO3411423.1 hypothetical protein [Saccharibacillus sp. CPCC 101409]
MNEIGRLTGRIEDWTEELLLRGASQFTHEDAARLERWAGEAERLGMELLERLLRRLSRTGARSLLDAEEKTEELTGLFFRLCAYLELAGGGDSREEGFGRGDEEEREDGIADAQRG